LTASRSGRQVSIASAKFNKAFRHDFKHFERCFLMNTNISIRVVSFVVSFAFGLGSGASAFAQISTNGNGGPTDVGTWYEPLYTLVPPGPVNQWNGSGSYLNNLPLVNWSEVFGSPNY
jgi:hypothetical protein